MSLLLGIIVIGFSPSEEVSIRGWMFLITGIFTSLMSGLLLYGFGEMIETNQKMYGLMLRAVDSDLLKRPMQQGTWTCGACWNINPKGGAECAKCGAPAGAEIHETVQRRSRTANDA